MRKLKLIFLLFLTFVFALNAEARIYRFLTHASGACPIQLYVNGEFYWIATSSSVVELDLSGSNNEFYAIDAFGQNMNYEKYGSADGAPVTVELGAFGWANHGKRRLYDYRNGQIVELDNSSSSSSSSYSNNNSSSSRSDSRSSLAGATGATLGTAAGGLMAAGLAGTLTGGSTECYPNIQLQVGASHVYAEFARIKWMIGGGAGMGMVLYGGVGKEYIFDIKNENMLDEWTDHKRLPWHAGLGAFFITDSYNNSHDLTLAMTFTETPAITNYAVMLDLTWSKYFGSNRFGFFIGGGIGIGDTKDKNGKFMWDANIGIALKLWQHN